MAHSFCPKCMIPQHINANKVGLAVPIVIQLSVIFNRILIDLRSSKYESSQLAYCVHKRNKNGVHVPFFAVVAIFSFPYIFL